MTHPAQLRGSQSSWWGAGASLADEDKTNAWFAPLKRCWGLRHSVPKTRQTRGTMTVFELSQIESFVPVYSSGSFVKLRGSMKLQNEGLLVSRPSGVTGTSQALGLQSDDGKECSILRSSTCQACWSPKGSQLQIYHTAPFLLL